MSGSPWRLRPDRSASPIAAPTTTADRYEAMFNSFTFAGGSDRSPRSPTSLDSPHSPSTPVFDNPLYDDEVADDGSGFAAIPSAVGDVGGVSDGKRQSAAATSNSDFFSSVGDARAGLGNGGGVNEENVIEGFGDLAFGFGANSRWESPADVKWNDAHASPKANAGIAEADPFEFLSMNTNSSHPAIPVPNYHFNSSDIPMNFDNGGIDKPASVYETKGSYSKSSEPVDDSDIWNTFNHFSGSDPDNEELNAGKFDEFFQSTYEVWLTVSDVILITRPTEAPPPFRLPPPLRHISSEAKEQVSQPTVVHNNVEVAAQASSMSPLDELFGFAMPTDKFSEMATKADRKVENFKCSNEMKHDLMSNKKQTKNVLFGNIADRKGQQWMAAESEEYPERGTELEAERERKQRQNKEVELKRLEDESEMEKERAERDAEMAKEDAQQRAAAEKEAHQRAEREAVMKVAAQARARAAALARERALNASAEGNERDAAEARERAAAMARELGANSVAEAREKALAEARERTAAEARERAAAEAKERADTEARERAAAEARERAAAEVRARAAAEARERVAAEEREQAVAKARERAAMEARERAAVAARERAATMARVLAAKVAVEARERAAVEARERAAKAAAEARERAAAEARERDAKVAAEAREKAAAEARERAAKAAAEAREQALSEEREKAAAAEARKIAAKVAAEARERAATEARERAARASAEARERAATEVRERAAAEMREVASKAAAEARERAATEARERAAKAASEARERAAAQLRERAARQARERMASNGRDRVTADFFLSDHAAAEKSGAELLRRAERAAVERAERAAVERAERAERVAAEARAKSAAAEALAKSTAAEKAAAEVRERQAAASRENKQKPEVDLEAIFGMGSRTTGNLSQGTTSTGTNINAQARSGKTVGPSSTFTQPSSANNIMDDLFSVFGAPASSEAFQEIEGETEERRRARLERHQRTLEKAAKALADKKNRDMQIQREQEEKHRIAETLDLKIKRWAAGKEGNLRALLSTLHYILWAECGWQPVSLADLVAAAAVRKEYRKATLCIHPDKVQQKGANIEQRYIAEKVFDILKEAWNKFNSEVLF